MATKKTPTLSQSIAPNTALIKGAASVYGTQGFTPVDTVGESMFKIMEPVFQKRAQNRARKDADWDMWLNKLGPDVSPEGLNEKQTEAIRNYTMNARTQYADYFNIVSKPGIDKQSEEYINALNGMNSITKNFETLANQKNAYLANQENFIKNKSDGNFSLGSDDNVYNNALEIYGTGTDGEGMDFSITNGNITFNTSNGPIRFQDFKDPFKKDYAGALGIQELANSVINKGKTFTQATGDTLATELNAQFASNPNGMMSIVADGTLRGYDFSGITEEDLSGDPEALRNKVVQTIVKQVKTKTNNNVQSTGGDGYSSDYYAPEFTGKVDEKGNKIYNRFPKDPNKKPIVFTMEDVAGSNPPPIETDENPTPPENSAFSAESGLQDPNFYAAFSLKYPKKPNESTEDYNKRLEEQVKKLS